MCVRVLPKIEKTLIAQSSTERFVPCTDWFPSTGVDQLTFQFILRNLSGALGARPGVEWAAVRTDDPYGTITSVGTQRTAAGEYQNAITFSDSQKGPMFYMRIGLLYETTSGDTESYGEVTMVPTMHHCGRVVGAQEVVVNPGLGDTTRVAWFELSEWFPLVAIDKAKAAFIVERCNSANLRYILGCRTAVDTSVPNDWVEMEGGTYAAPGVGNSERNTDQESFPAGADVSNNVYGQLGLGILQSSAAELRAIFKVASAVTYS